MTSTYRKKPVEVQAINPAHHEPTDEVFDFLGRDRQVAPDLVRPDEWAIDPATGGILIGTLEGTMLASPGDWIIRGVQGEFYRCKPDIFDATYDAVEVSA